MKNWETIIKKIEELQIEKMKHSKTEMTKNWESEKLKYRNIEELTNRNRPKSKNWEIEIGQNRKIGKLRIEKFKNRKT